MMIDNKLPNINHVYSIVSPDILIRWKEIIVNNINDKQFYNEDPSVSQPPLKLKKTFSGYFWRGKYTYIRLFPILLTWGVHVIKLLQIKAMFCFDICGGFSF